MNPVSEISRWDDNMKLFVNKYSTEFPVDGNDFSKIKEDHELFSLTFKVEKLRTELSMCYKKRMAVIQNVIFFFPL